MYTAAVHRIRPHPTPKEREILNIYIVKELVRNEKLYVIVISF